MILLRAYVFPEVLYYLLRKTSHFLMRKHTIIKRNRRQDYHIIYLFEFQNILLMQFCNGIFEPCFQNPTEITPFLP